MKRIGGLWDEIVAFSNLYRAYLKARKGKGRRDDVARFALNLEENLFALQRELRTGTYRPGSYRQFTIYERKPRVISAAPFRDRVVHHALMNLVEPVLDRSFIPDSYACRHDKGVHAAVDRYQGWAGRHRYVLKLDIRRYFPSIDHAILKEELRRRLRDPPLLAVLDWIIDGSPDSPADPEWFPGDTLFTPLERHRGIPIGNLTSQIFANLYLDRFDHWVKEVLGVGGYLRYVDDMVLLADDKAVLWGWRDEVASRLEGLRLRLYPDKAQVFRTDERVDVLGYKVSQGRRWLRNDNGYRFGRKMRGMARCLHEGRMTLVQVTASVRSWIGHAQHGETEGLRRAMFEKIVF